MNINAEPKLQEENTLANGWGEVAKMAREYMDEQAEKAPERATRFYKEALNIQIDFDRRTQAIESKNETMTKKEFEKWEDALSDEITYADKELKSTDYTLETIANSEQAMIFSADSNELHKTIEARAGFFYRDRMNALRQAISTSADEKASEDLEYAKDFYNVVMTHLDYRYMPPEDIRDYGYDKYDHDRTRAHNAVINHLNNLNNLAKKYNVRPFTVRNFWTSDLRDEKHQTASVAKVMRYDHYIVEEYYSLAFTSEAKRREYILNRQMRSGI